MISSAILAQNNKTNYNPVVAHRGAWKKNNLPQNSIASLKKAIEIGCIGSEFDVRMTADETLVINHDSDYHGFQIEKTNYNQLISFPLSNGEKLPTLKEYLEAGFENNNYTKLVIEIKLLRQTASHKRQSKGTARISSVQVRLTPSPQMEPQEFFTRK